MGKTRRKNRRMAVAVAALLTPAAFLVGVVGLWRVFSDLGITSGFAISSGIFSHWQVWLATAVLLQLCARMLNRYGRGDETVAPGGRNAL